MNILKVCTLQGKGYNFSFFSNFLNVKKHAKFPQRLLPVINRDISHFVNFILVYVGVNDVIPNSYLHMEKTLISRERNKILKNQGFPSSSFR